MSHPIEQKISVLRSRVRRLVAVHGLSWIVALVVGAVIVLGVADYLVRFRDPGLRVICSLLLLAAVVWTCYRYLYLPLFVRLSEVDLALRVQRRFPALEDRLVSSVEFLKQSEDDPVAGSAALRRAVVAQTTAETEQLDFCEVLDPRPPFRAALVTVSVCLVAAILLVLAPEASQTAVARLANPFGVPWPQRTHLQVRPLLTRAAKGRPVEVRVVDARGAKLPRTVNLHYRFEGPDGTVTDQTQPMRPVDEAMVARLEPVRPFSYRAEGGDDTSMGWIAVEVVDAPAVESLSIRLIPPPYTGWPPEEAQGHFRALVGTRIQFAAKATRPLRSAELCLAGEASAARMKPSSLDREPDRTIPARLSDDGYRFTLPGPQAAELMVEPSWADRGGIAYWLRLTDREGLSGDGESDWEISAIADEPPLVSIKQPSDTVFATAEAVVPLQVAARDDLAIHQLDLVYQPSSQPAEGQGEPEPSVAPLYIGPDSVDPRPAGALSRGPRTPGTTSNVPDRWGGDRREVEYRWELAELGLSPGTELTFHVRATDYRPQTGLSQAHRLVVITPEQLHERIAERQGAILAELARVLKMQGGSRKQVKSLEIRLAEVGHLEQQDVDRLQGAELSQREVGRSLTSRSAGVPVHVLALLADLDNNRLDGPDVRRRMESLLNEIARLDREHLGSIGRELTAAIKSAQVRLQQGPTSPPGDKGDGPSGGPSSIGDPLAEAGKHQDQVIDSLQLLLEQLGEWDKYRRFHREISQLLAEQKGLGSSTSEVGRHTLSKELKDLLPQEVADLKVLAAEQLGLARQFDRIQQQMDQAGVELSQSDPLAAETVADALAAARRLAITGQMLSAGGHVERNQIGQATARQRQIVVDLQEVLDVLANRRQQELARLVKKLAEAEGELAEIQRRQAELQKRIEEASQAPDDARRRQELQRLAQQQAELEQETERLARRLERLLAAQAGGTTRQAAGHMGQAGHCAGQGDCQGAGRQSAAAQNALEEARRQLAARRRQAQADLATEQMAQLEDNLKHLRAQQENFLKETRRLAGLQDRGELSRAETASLRDLAGQQASLQNETAQLGDKLAAAGAFQMTLSRAGRSMGQAAALLNRQQTGLPTQEAETNALERLDLLLEALKKEPPSEAQSSGAGGADGNQGGQGGKPGAVERLAELKLLRLLQADVNLRTTQLQEAAKAPDALTDVQRRQHAELSEEQGRLADLVSQLLQVERENPEDAPAGLPDLGPDQPEEENGPLPDEEQIR